ncbi:MAG: hypothetical protein ACOC31_06565 [Bacteroidota bacterium]
MKNRKIATLFALLLLAGVMFSSCRSQKQCPDAYGEAEQVKTETRV